MTACPQPARGPFRCPTQDEILASALALLPRGRAWQTHEGGPEPVIQPLFQPNMVQPGPFQVGSLAGSIIWRFFDAVAGVFEYVHQQFCALRLEFWCQTQTVTTAQWMIEYGLPDACDPFPDLCTKVSAIGSPHCDFYAQIAARAGWSITCANGSTRCTGVKANARGAKANKRGATAGGGASRSQLYILVDTGNSPAYQPPTGVKPLANRMKANQRLRCGPKITPLQCLLDRVVRAHVAIIYQIA